MTNSLNELSDVYLSQVAEQEGSDNTPENVKVRVLQIVKAIRYKAKKEGGNLVKAFNDYMGGQSGIGAAERQMVKQRLGLSEEVGITSTEKMQKALKDAQLKKKEDEAVAKAQKVKKESYSNWREDLREIVQQPETDTEMDVKIKEKKVKNKIVINPPMQEEIKKMGGEILEMTEIEEQDVVGGVSLSPQEIQTQKRMAMLNVRLAKQRQKSLQKAKSQDDVKKEDYETKKKGEVLKALDKKDFVKRYGKKKAPDVMYAVAAKTAKQKGDTSKSDDRYAYEEVQVEEKKILPKLKMYRKAGNLARAGDEKSMKRQTKMVSVLNKETSKGYKDAALSKLRDGGSPKHQTQEDYKKLPVAKMASKISKKQFKAGQSGDVKTISKKSTETGKMIGVLDTHDPQRSKAKSKIKEGKAFDFIKKFMKEDEAYKKTVKDLKDKFGTGVLASKQDFEDHKKREAAKPLNAKQIQKKDERSAAQREVDARYGRTPWNKKGSLGT